MSTLDKAIRACSLGSAQEAVLAVLDLHESERVLGRGRSCAVCLDAYGDLMDYPCPTVKAIADTLGVRGQA